MNDFPDRIALLIFKQLKQEASEEEAAELERWKQASPEHAAFFSNMMQEGHIAHGLRELAAAQKKTTLQLLEKGIPLNQERSRSEAVRPIPLLQRSWLRYAAAVIVLLGVAGYFFFNRADPKKIVKVSPERPPQTDIAPGAQRATLTLANGVAILLDSAADGLLAKQGATSIEKLQDGQIVYHPLTQTAGETMYNTMTTPRGGQYQMSLPDGTKVWLNAASSITYPAAFTGNDRSVTISGEVYFEVARDKAKPFLVTVNHIQIEVLGTHFNVNAYPDESSVNTTLLEGAVKIRHEKTFAALQPGQQAAIDKTGKLTIDKQADLIEVMAWKNGRFEFSGHTIEPVMRQVSRWYNVDIEYIGPRPDDHFMGSVSRMENVSEVLKALEQTDAVQFNIEGKKIIVSKK